MTYVKVCLQCGSTNIKIPPASLDVQVTVPDYCMECGNRGRFPEVEKENLEDFRKKINSV